MYILDWMLQRGFSLDEVLLTIKEGMVEKAMDGTLDSDMNVAFDQGVEYFNERGFGGEMYVCFDEFIDTYFYDEPEYMLKLLASNEKLQEEYRKMVNQKKMVQIDDHITIKKMIGEPQYTGKSGIVTHFDDADQIHGTWGGLAIVPDADEFEITLSPRTRCADCVYLFERDGKWFCDHAQKFCRDITDECSMNNQEV